MLAYSIWHLHWILFQIDARPAGQACSRAGRAAAEGLPFLGPAAARSFFMTGSQRTILRCLEHFIESWMALQIQSSGNPCEDGSTIVEGLDKFKYMKVSEPRSFDSCTKCSLVCASVPYSGYSSAATFITKKSNRSAIGELIQSSRQQQNQIAKNFRCRDSNPGLSGESRVS